MKKIAFLALLLPSIAFAQEKREEISSNEVSKGFYGNITVNQISSFDETINGKLSAGMHFDKFHVGLHYVTSFGENKMKIDRIVSNLNTELKYSGFGVDLMYEIDIHDKFSIAPMLNLSLMDYEYTHIPIQTFAAIDDTSDKFINTQIGTKVFFTPNKNFKIGLDLGYNIARGVNLYQTENEDLSGLNLGLTLQFNHFLPKW